MNLRRASFAERRGEDPFPHLERARRQYEQAFAVTPNGLFVQMKRWSLEFKIAKIQFRRGIDPTEALDKAERYGRDILAEQPGELLRTGQCADVANLKAEHALATRADPTITTTAARLVATRLYEMLVACGFAGTIRGNAQLPEFIETIAMQRPHPQWPERSVADVFAEECERLPKLPNPLPSTDLVQAIVADKTAFVRFDAHRAALLEEKRAARIPKGRDRLHAEIPGVSMIRRKRSLRRSDGRFDSQEDVVNR